jgi:hypothetical protein
VVVTAAAQVYQIRSAAFANWLRLRPYVRRYPHGLGSGLGTFRSGLHLIVVMFYLSHGGEGPPTLGIVPRCQARTKDVKETATVTDSRFKRFLGASQTYRLCSMAQKTKPKSKPDDPAQYKRFLEATRKAEADETKEGADEAFKKVASQAPKAHKDRS